MVRVPHGGLDGGGAAVDAHRVAGQRVQTSPPLQVLRWINALCLRLKGGPAPRPPLKSHPDRRSDLAQMWAALSLMTL